MEPGESDITKKYTLYMETQNYQQLYNLEDYNGLGMCKEWRVKVYPG
jgi:hypothetical protein